MTFNLRPYQDRAIAETREAFLAGRWAPLVASPTGSGKTAIAVTMIRRSLDKHGAGYQALFTCPRRELVGQTVAALRRVGVEPSVIMAGHDGFDPDALVQVASLDTLRARCAKGKPGIPGLNPKLIVIDEAHLAISDKRVEVLSQWPEARLIGLTATPARLDGKPLNTLFDCMVHTASTASLTTDGYLVPAKYWISPEPPSLIGVKVTGGDYNMGQLESAVMPLVGNVVEHWQKLASNRRTVVFATKIAHSQALVAEFKAAGVAAEHVDANTPTQAREAIFERFRTGETQVLSNCFLASYGFDLPDLDCVVLARPTKSLVLYLQMIGRGLRPAPGKEDCIVLDHAGCVHEHGFATDPRKWSLDGKEGVERAEPNRVKECPSCGYAFEPPKDWDRLCPQCGHYFEPKTRRPVEVADVDLVEAGDITQSLDTYRQLLWIAQARGYRPGFAGAKFKDWFGGKWPPRAWAEYEPLEPTPEVEARVRADAKAWAREQRKRRTQGYD